VCPQWPSSLVGLLRKVLLDHCVQGTWNRSTTVFNCVPTVALITGGVTAVSTARPLCPRSLEPAHNCVQICATMALISGGGEPYMVVSLSGDNLGMARNTLCLMKNFSFYRKLFLSFTPHPAKFLFFFQTRILDHFPQPFKV
jgi:hypothetical protein